MLAKFEYMMWVMHGMVGIVKTLFDNNNIQATYPKAYSVQNLSIIPQAAHIMPDCGRRQAFFSSLQNGPQMKLLVDSLQIERSPPTCAMITAIMLRPLPLISLPLFDNIIDYYGVLLLQE